MSHPPDTPGSASRAGGKSERPPAALTRPAGRRPLSAAGLLAGLLLGSLLTPAPLHAGLDRAMALAQGLELAEDPQWLRLLAYERRAFWPGRVGRVQSPGFYLHEDGSEDPEAELRATLEALYAPAVPGATGAHAACQFPARRAFLVERLGLRLRGQPLPDPACPAYQAWRDRMGTERIVLVYADAYMGNPASMFGHTLLRLDSRADLQRPLTAYAVNHAARAGGDSGVLFAMRGVLGSYPGLYAVMPYYYKVNQYTRMEQRDLWAYELDLDDAAIDRLLAHLWELDGAAMPYYFFLHNCSYRLLTLLEVADPSLTLREDFGLWAIPSDTIRAVTAEAGLVREVRYRPSRRRVLDHMLGDLASEHAEQARALARGDLEPDDEAIAALPEREQARILETADAYLAQLGHVRDIGDEGRRRRHDLLAARADVDGPSIAPPPRPEQRPDEGHGTGRAGLGLGTHGGVGYAELQWRAAYHGLLDPPGGYLRGAHVSFLSIAARAYEHGEPRDGHGPDGGVELERLQLLRARSLEPRNRPFPGWAWGAGVGVERMRDADGDRPLMAHLEADLGPAWAWRDGRLRLYTGAGGTLRASGHLDGGLRLGGGVRAEVVHQAADWRLRLTLRGQRFSDGRDAWQLAGRVARDVGPQTALRLSLQREQDLGVRSDRIQLTLHRYL